MLNALKLTAMASVLAMATACTAAPDVYHSAHASFRLETIATGLEHPWSLAFLPDGSILVTERAGRLRLIRNGQLQAEPMAGVPELVVAGQGGLLDVILHPQFSDNQLLFLSYAHENSEGKTTRVSRARLDDNQLSDGQVIFEARPRSGTSHHFAGRMAFDLENNLLIAVGDRGDRDRAQDTSDDAGSVHRITVEGAAAPGNPFLGSPDHSPTLFSYGHRNIQGMTQHPVNGEIWTHEHGPRGGDEINILAPATNYGWPAITYGIGYSGLAISDETTRPGMAQPLHYWAPSIAPSGMAFYTGTEVPAWQGNLFVGALKMQKLVRLRIENGKVSEEEDLISDFGRRIRDVRMGPDGRLWLLTDDSNGEVLRLIPE